jgi:nitrate/TMAO reductase-like tetraheme cytochrome c subunit
MDQGVRRWTTRGIATILIVGAIAFIALGAGGIVAWEYSNSDQFCASTCHSVHPEEIRAHATSSHARVKCVECHIGRISTLHMMALKPEHAKELWGMIVGYERPLTSTTLRPSRQNCEGCHWPSVEHHDSIAIIKRYAADADSTETATRLVLHTAMGAVREKKARGIHWHIENDVQFIATDPQRRTIPWVQVKGADGKTTTYVDATAKVTPEELKKHTPRRMECFDCHNQVGHPLQNPVNMVDEAIALGRIDRSLPNTKARAVALIDQASKLAGMPDTLAPQIDKLIADSVPKDLAADMKDKEAKFQKEMKRILLDSSFSRSELSWKSFPNHTGHNDFPGCFRCHNGKHLNDKGEAIRLQCTLCHDLPQVKREGGKGSVASTVMAGLSPPSSHDAPNFMRDHRTRFDDSCTMCHGKLEFGRDGGNFCANPACHGRKYPEVSLSAKP